MRYDLLEREWEQCENGFSDLRYYERISRKVYVGNFISFSSRYGNDF